MSGLQTFKNGSAPASEAERWYDDEIAPALRELAEKCKGREVAILAQVEFEPGHFGRTAHLDGAGLEMTMLELCARMQTDLDGYVIRIRHLARQRGIDVSNSIFLFSLDREQEEIVLSAIDVANAEQRARFAARLCELAAGGLR